MPRRNARPEPAAAAAAGAAPATTAAAAAPVAGCRLAALAPLVPPARWEFCGQGAPRFHSAGPPILSPQKIPKTIPRNFQCARAGRLDASPSPTRPCRRQESACFCAFRRAAHPPGPGRPMGGGGSGPLGGGPGSLTRGVARRGGGGRRGGRGRTRDGGGRRPWCSRAASPCCVYVCAMYAYTSCYIL